MIKTYVLIVTNPGVTREIVDALLAMDLVVAAHEVMGPYDIVAEIEAEELSAIPDFLATQIRTLEGIHSTTSLVAASIPALPAASLNTASPVSFLAMKSSAAATTRFSVSAL